MKRITLFTISMLTINAFAATSVKDFGDLVGSRKSQTVLKEVLKEHPLVVAKCFSTWCPKCKRVAPGFSALADKYRNKALFLDINVEDFDEIIDRFDLKSIPTFLIFIHGKLAKKIRGSGRLDEVAKYLSSTTKRMN